MNSYFHPANKMPKLCRSAQLPRRRLRGLSLVEAVLSLILFAIAADGLSKLYARELVRLTAREEFRLLDEAAEAGAAWVERDMIARISPAIGTLVRIDTTTLTSSGLWSPAKPSVTRRKRNIEIWYHALNNNTVLVFAVAGADISPPSLPEGDPAVEAVGWISPQQPNTITGPNLLWNLPYNFKTIAPTAFRPGAAVAMRHLSLARDAMPYLYRKAVPSQPALNTMSTDLVMGGNDITGLGQLSAGTITASTANVAGLTAQSVTASGSISSTTMTISGAIKAGRATLSGPLSATSATIGAVNATTLSANSAQISTLTVNNHATASSLTVLGTFSANKIDTPILTLNHLTAGTATARQVGTTKLISADAIIKNLTVETCTGC